MRSHGIFFTLGVILLVIAYKGYEQNKIENQPEVYKEFTEI